MHNQQIFLRVGVWDCELAVFFGGTDCHPSREDMPYRVDKRTGVKSALPFLKKNGSGSISKK